MADDPATTAGTPSPSMRLVDAQSVLEEMLSVFREMTARIEGGETVTTAEVGRARSTFASARMAILDEVTKHEASILSSEGLLADAPLDLDELRSSIGGRLDRIRDSRGTG